MGTEPLNSRPQRVYRRTRSGPRFSHALFCSFVFIRWHAPFFLVIVPVVMDVVVVFVRLLLLLLTVTSSRGEIQTSFPRQVSPGRSSIATDIHTLAVNPVQVVISVVVQLQVRRIVVVR